MWADRHLKSLPNIGTCKKIFQSVATLDTILSPEWEYRYYSFNSVWNKDEMMASMRDGQGSNFFALFNNSGLMIKGFDNYLGRKSVDEVYRKVPLELKNFLQEPAFTIDLVTFCVWNTNKHWVSSINYQPAELDLLKVLTFGPEGYWEWAKNYYEIEIPLIDICNIFKFEPLTQEAVRRINPNAELTDIVEDIKEINYPIIIE